MLSNEQLTSGKFLVGEFLPNEQEEEIIEEPMGDDDIKHYFPNAKIITYSQLNDMNNIEELLPNDKTFSFMLIEDSPNRGHWVGLSRYGDIVEFFDSYGGKPDSQLKWNSKEKNVKLGQGKHSLSRLLDNFNGKVVYNPVKYQEDASDVNTCGRHCTFRILNMKDGKNLEEYYKYMNRLKNNTGKNYDEIVANFVQK
jgi:hypothetical protein